MKRNLFKLMMLVVLVVIANAAFAQETSPVVGVSYDYTVSGISPANSGTYAFSVNTSTTTSGGSVSATITDGTGSVSGGSTSTATITWNGTGTYSLWIAVTGTATGTCSNYRYVSVTPVANTFDATIIAVGTSTGTSADADGCPVPYNFDYTTSADNDGSTYIYYYVTLAGFTKNFGWNASVDVTGISGEEYSTDGSSWSTTAPDDVAITTTSFWARVSVPVENSPVTYTASVTATEDVNAAGTKTAPDSDGSDNSASFILDGVPNLDGATFN